MSYALASRTDRMIGSYSLNPPLVKGKAKLTYV